MGGQAVAVGPDGCQVPVEGFHGRGQGSRVHLQAQESGLEPQAVQPRPVPVP